MQFAIVASCASNPPVFYDGQERERFSLTVQLDGQAVELQLDPSAPENRQWRHYYNDAELNELSSLVGLKFEFRMSREVIVAPSHRKLVYFQPFWSAGRELTVCYSCDEVSNGHYVCWLLAVLSRAIAESEFNVRVANIKRYWLK